MTADQYFHLYPKVSLYAIIARDWKYSVHVLSMFSFQDTLYSLYNHAILDSLNINTFSSWKFLELIIPFADHFSNTKSLPIGKCELLKNLQTRLISYHDIHLMECIYNHSSVFFSLRRFIYSEMFAFRLNYRIDKQLFARFRFGWSNISWHTDFTSLRRW